MKKFFKYISALFCLSAFLVIFLGSGITVQSLINAGYFENPALISAIFILIFCSWATG